jgi:acetylornithine/succinyldiaminopimelate/putrescine aminotransferase
MASLQELDVYPRLALDVVGTEGCDLVLADGRRVLDLYGGHCVNTLGGNAPEILDAVREQWGRVSFVTNLLDHAPRARFLAALGAGLPEGDWRVFLSNSGAEANENALKAALIATRRRAVIAFTGAFHGRTAAAAAVTDSAKLAFPAAPFEVRRAPWGDLEAVDALLDDQVAAVILEPIQSLAGVVCPPPGFLEGLRELTRQRGAALIFDEVQTASGRTGHPWVAQTYGVTPDVMTTAKGAGGGLPIGLTVIAEPLARALGHGSLGSTFGGGPTVLAAATVVAEHVSRPDFLSNVRATSQALRAAAQLGPVEEVRGEGLLLGLVLREGLKAATVRNQLLEHDVHVGTSNDPRVLRLSPPLTLTPSDASRLARAFERLDVPVS